jgi:nucleoside transporter
MVRSKLSTMMFLQYFVWGTWYVTIGNYLSGTLRFSDGEIGLAYGTTAVASMVSPLFLGIVADRFFASERILAILHGFGGALLYIASLQTTMLTFYPALLAYTLCYVPTVSLTNSLSFHHMERQRFPAVRVFGTIGWIVAGLLVGFLKIEPTVIPMQIAAAASVAMGVYCLVLPHTPPGGSQDPVKVSSMIGLGALPLLRDRSLLAFVASSFLICIPIQFYYAFADLFLNEAGMTNAAAKMTFGQIAEIFFMLMIPMLWLRLGIKWLLVVGLATWIVRYVLFACGFASPQLFFVLYIAVFLHGVCYDCFFVSGYMYVDRVTFGQARGEAQGFITFVTLGIGTFIGSLFSGWVVRLFSYTQGDQVLHHWDMIWLIAAICSAVPFLLFALAFKDREVSYKAAPA